MYSEAWINILQSVKDYSLEGRSPVWFRGHSNLDYELHSGLFRLDYEDINEYLSSERVLYRRFINLGHLHHNETDWNLLYLMQHHGVLTRLLDWSESFNVALFFAFNEWKTDDFACIWMLRPTKLNDASKGNLIYKLPREGVPYENHIFNKDFPFDPYSVALYPMRNSSRLVAQQGVFTLQGNSMLPLDREHDARLVNDGNLKKIILTPDMRADIRDYLELSGVNYYTLFPDLDGLSKYINRSFANRKRTLSITN
ncbi:FRG domain-containing protein [Paenibacillus polysaccharolyticus]|uniref:FRG domain-containing protein n=1 Tax=Paenibacillus polysaccharolyticus TaxID=582692 RepID=UPI00209ED06C|nr:FRG domain-containing protein [Paenibacillus polysaccharolyticus]